MKYRFIDAEEQVAGSGYIEFVERRPLKVKGVKRVWVGHLGEIDHGRVSFWSSGRNFEVVSHI